MIVCLLNCIGPWWRNRSSGSNSGFGLHNRSFSSIVSIEFWYSAWDRLHNSFSHDYVIGFIGVGGGSLKVFNLHLMSWRVWHRHVHVRNNFFSNGGSRDTFFFLFVIG